MEDIMVQFFYLFNAIKVICLSIKHLVLRYFIHGLIIADPNMS